DQAAPTPGFSRELLAARGGDRVKPRAAIVVRRPPRALDPAARLESLQRRIERSMIDEQRVARPLLDDPRDTLAVMGAQREDAQNQKIERSLHEGIAFGIVVLGWHPTREYHRLGRMSTGAALAS